MGCFCNPPEAGMHSLLNMSSCKWCFQYIIRWSIGFSLRIVVLDKGGDAVLVSCVICVHSIVGKNGVQPMIRSTKTLSCYPLRHLTMPWLNNKYERRAQTGR